MSKKLKNEKIRGLLVKRGKKPVVIEIDAENRYDALSDLLGGLIDRIEVYNPTGITDIIFNDESKVNGSKPNRLITSKQVYGNGSNTLYDIVYGDFLMLCVDEEGGYISLSDSEIERWSKEFDFTAPPFVSKELYNKFFSPQIFM